MESESTNMAASEVVSTQPVPAQATVSPQIQVSASESLQPSSGSGLNGGDSAGSGNPEPVQEQVPSDEDGNTHTNNENNVPTPQATVSPEKSAVNEEETRNDTNSTRNDETDPDTSNEQDQETSDFTFKKKNVKPRTQSFQSVLSTASLKSLNQPSRNSNSISINQGLAHSNNNSTKNFQSFIQAPVLSSISNLKNPEDTEIGRQLPFVHDSYNNGPPLIKPTPTQAHSVNVLPNNGSSTATRNPSSSESQEPENGDDQYDDQDTILQQQKLTLNALKKLSLSPLPRIEHQQEQASIDSEASKLPTKSSRSSMSNIKKPEPYQPAEVDLSTFASLTRQPNHNYRSVNSSDNSPSKTDKSGANSADSGSTVSPSNSDKNSANKTNNSQTPMSQSQATQKYHHDVYQSHQNQSNPPNGSHPNGSQPNVLQPQLQQSQLQQSQYQPQFEQPPQTQAALKIQTSLPKNTLLSDLNSRRRSNNSSPLTLMNRIPSPSQQVSSQQLYSKQLAPVQVQTQAQNISQQSSLPPTSATASVPGTMTSVAGRPTLGQRQLSQGQESYFKLPQHQQGQTESPSYSQLSKTNQKHLQQIKGLRSPMYIPAVLRKTMDANNGNNGTSIKDEGYDSFNGSSATSIKSFDSNISTDSISSSPLVATPTGGSNSNYKTYKHFLRQPPTKKHWVKDESVYKCSKSGCDKEFNFFERRHHCRKCGRIYCKEHTSHYLYINHLAQFTTGGRGTLSKVCDECIGEYNEFIKSEFGVNVGGNGANSFNGVNYSTDAQSLAYERQTGNKSAPVITSHTQNITDHSPVAQLGPSQSQIPGAPPVAPEAKPLINKHINKPHLDTDRSSEQVVGSVPANWSWSSF